MPVTVVKNPDGTMTMTTPSGNVITKKARPGNKPTKRSPMNPAGKPWGM